MLQDSPPPQVARSTPVQLVEDVIDLDRLLLMVRRQALLVAIIGIVGFCLAVVYAMSAQPRFTASTTIILGDTAAAPRPEQNFGSGTEADTLIAGQIEVLRSARIAQMVVEKIGVEALDVASPPSLMSRLRAAARWLLVRPSAGDAGTAVEVDPAVEAATALQQSIYIQRLGRSLSIVIGFTSPDPELAARVPNAYAEAYIADQEAAIRLRADESRDWLQQQMQGLRQDLFEAELAVEDFRAANGLAQPGGQLISERMIVDLNLKIVEAMSELGQLRARAAQLGEMLDSTDPQRLAAVPAEVLAGDAGEGIRLLRDDYAAAAARLAEIVARSGTNHPEAVALSAQLNRLRERLVAQLRTIHRQVSDSAEVASRRVDYLNVQLAAAVERNATDNKKMIELSNLQQVSESYKTLFRNYLAQYQETALKRSAPQVTAQVLSAANRPIVPSSPQKARIAIGGLLLGLIAGAIIAALREYAERYYRTGNQLSQDLGTEFLGSLPTRHSGLWSSRSGGEDGLFKGDVPALGMWKDDLEADTSETLRRALVVSELKIQRRKPKVVGIISALPEEGKSTFAINLGRLLASSGKKAILIDADFRKPGVANAMATAPSAGFVELLLGEASLEDVIQVDDATGLSVIPSLPSGDTPRISQLISSPQMDALLKKLGAAYDYVVIDLPPMGLVADARVLASRIDGFFMVVRWGRTPRRVVQDTLAGEPLVRAKLLGVVLNRVNLRRIRRYLPFGSAERYREKYQYYTQPTARKET